MGRVNACFRYVHRVALLDVGLLPLARGHSWTIFRDFTSIKLTSMLVETWRDAERRIVVRSLARAGNPKRTRDVAMKLPSGETRSELKNRRMKRDVREMPGTPCTTPARPRRDVLHVCLPAGSFQRESAFSSAHYNIPDIEIRVVCAMALSVAEEPLLCNASPMPVAGRRFCNDFAYYSPPFPSFPPFFLSPFSFSFLSFFLPFSPSD